MSKNSELFEQAKHITSAAFTRQTVCTAAWAHRCILTTWMDAICTTRMAREYLDFPHPPVRLFGYRHPRLMAAAQKALDGQPDEF